MKMGGGRKNIWRNNNKIFQIWYLQSSGLRNSTNTKLRKYEENYAKAHHINMAQNRWWRGNLKSSWKKKTCYIHRNSDNSSIVIIGNNTSKETVEQKSLKYWKEKKKNCQHLIWYLKKILQKRKRQEEFFGHKKLNECTTSRSILQEVFKDILQVEE